MSVCHSHVRASDVVSLCPGFAGVEANPLSGLSSKCGWAPEGAGAYVTRSRMGMRTAPGDMCAVGGR